MELVGNQPNEKRRRNQSSAKQRNDVSAYWRVTENFGPRYPLEQHRNKQNDRQRDKGVHVKEWHRCVKRDFDPKGQRALSIAAGAERSGWTGIIGRNWELSLEVIRVRRVCAARARVNAPGYSVSAEVFFPPMPKQNQRRRDCVKPAALSHEHGKRNAFPGDFVAALIVQKLQGLQKLKASYSAVE